MEIATRHSVSSKLCYMEKPSGITLTSCDQLNLIIQTKGIDSTRTHMLIGVIQIEQNCEYLELQARRLSNHSLEFSKYTPLYQRMPFRGLTRKVTS